MTPLIQQWLAKASDSQRSQLNLAVQEATSQGVPVSRIEEIICRVIEADKRQPLVTAIALYLNVPSVTAIAIAEQLLQVYTDWNWTHEEILIHEAVRTGKLYQSEFGEWVVRSDDNDTPAARNPVLGTVAAWLVQKKSGVISDET